VQVKKIMDSFKSYLESNTSGAYKELIIGLGINHELLDNVFEQFGKEKDVQSSEIGARNDLEA
jgi:hypothetical protein